MVIAAASVQRSDNKKNKDTKNKKNKDTDLFGGKYVI